MGLLSSVQEFVRGNQYSGLGSYPNKASGLALRRLLRVGLIVIVAVSLGWLAISSTIGGINYTNTREGSMDNIDTDPNNVDNNAAAAAAANQQQQQVPPVPKVNDEADIIQDPRLLSKHCDVPHPGRPLIQYVMVIDAGSTGSRIHAYKFNYCKDQPELEDEIFKLILPGLSSYPDDPDAAAHSLDVLMDAAMEGIPPSLRKCSPITVKATAGLRLLGEEKSERILRAVESHLSRDYPFPVHKKDGVVVMNGRDEGIYAWITVNSLLGTLGKGEHLTAGTFDMGGGSTQIVFEPLIRNGNSSVPASVSPEYQSNLVISGQKHNLYQHSYLNYGLMEARRQVREAIATIALEQNKAIALSACFPTLFSEDIIINQTPIIIKGGTDDDSADPTASVGDYCQL